MAMSLAGAASAADEAVMVDGKPILVTSVDTGGNQVKYHSKDYQNGIFIRVSDDPNTFGGNEMLNAEALAKAIFVNHGFNVVDKVQDADISIQFGTDAFGSFKMANADTKAAHSNLPSVGKVSVGIGAAAASFASGGIAGGIGYIAGSFIQTDERTTFSGLVSKKPESKVRGYFGNASIFSSVKDGDQWAGFIFKYRLEKDNKATEDAILKLMVEKWVAQYMVLDSAEVPVATTASSAVATTDTLK